MRRLPIILYYVFLHCLCFVLWILTHLDSFWSQRHWKLQVYSTVWQRKEHPRRNQHAGMYCQTIVYYWSLMKKKLTKLVPYQISRVGRASFWINIYFEKEVVWQCCWTQRQFHGQLSIGHKVMFWSIASRVDSSSLLNFILATCKRRFRQTFLIVLKFKRIGYPS